MDVEHLALGAGEPAAGDGAAQRAARLGVKFSGRAGQDVTLEDDDGEGRLVGQSGLGRDELDLHKSLKLQTMRACAAQANNRDRPCGGCVARRRMI